jgi:hypothetical protein
MRADNSRFIVAAARQRSQATRDRVIQALRRLTAAGGTVTFDAVAKAAGVSRSWLYTQPDLRLEIGRLRAHQAGQRRAPTSPPIPIRQQASEASLRRRLETTGAELRRLRDDNQRLREQLAWAHGELRQAKLHQPPQPHDAPTSTRRGSTIGPCS